MFEINIELEGLEDIQQMLQAVPEMAELAIEDAAKTLRNLVIGRSPVYPGSGALKRSWSNVQRTSTGFTFGTNRDYAEILEEGLYTRVGPRTVQVGEGIFSRQAPGGIIAPLLADSNLMEQIVQDIAQRLIRSITRAA